MEDRGLRGLSLSEVVVALFLASVMCVLLANLFPGMVAAMRASEARAQALDLAESILAQEMAKPFASLGPTRELPAVQRDNEEFQPVLEVFDVPGHARLHLQGLRVRVAWTTGQQRREVLQEVWVANLKR